MSLCMAKSLVRVTLAAPTETAVPFWLDSTLQVVAADLPSTLGLGPRLQWMSQVGGADHKMGENTDKPSTV